MWQEQKAVDGYPSHYVYIDMKRNVQTKFPIVTISKAQIRYELSLLSFYEPFSMRGLIDCKKGRGFDENGHFIFVRMALPPSLYQMLEKDMVYRFTTALTVDNNNNKPKLVPDLLLRAFQEIKMAGVIAEMGTEKAWDNLLDMVKLKGLLVLEAEDKTFSFTRHALEPLFDSIFEFLKKLSPSPAQRSAMVVEWDALFATARQQQRAQAICKALAFFMRIVGERQALMYNRRLHALTNRFRAVNIPEDFKTAATKAWLTEAHAHWLRQQHGAKATQWLMRSLQPEDASSSSSSRSASFFRYAVAWLVFSSFDKQYQQMIELPEAKRLELVLQQHSKEPETMAQYDHHRLLFIRADLSSILWMFASLIMDTPMRRSGLWFISADDNNNDSRNNTAKQPRGLKESLLMNEAFERVLFHQVCHGTAETQLKALLFKSYTHALAELPGRIDAFVQRLRAFTRHQKHTYAQVYLPLLGAMGFE